MYQNESNTKSNSYYKSTLQQSLNEYMDDLDLLPETC